MIYKLLDGTRVRARHMGDDAGTVEFETCQRGETLSVLYLDGEEALNYLAHLTALDAIRFATVYGASAQTLATTGRARTVARAAVVGAAVVGTTVLSVLTPQTAPPFPGLYGATTAPVVTPSPVAPQPYRPEPHTSREGKRETLTPSPSATLSTARRMTGTRSQAPAPADIRISLYRDCTGHAQECIDAGALTFYAGNILAGHNYMGYQWLSRVPVGRTVRVISGPAAGTYTAYGHLRINRQGGTVPAFPGSPALVLQTCEGEGTGFSLLRRTSQ
ncbi:hypothetical protein [Streptomyces sp. NPDC002491]